jgi:hypothetical protein
MSIEQTVIRQETWEIQIKDTSLNAYRTYQTFHNEGDALAIYNNIEFRLVQEAFIDIGNSIQTN